MENNFLAFMPYTCVAKSNNNEYYTCGACYNAFKTLCKLHLHLGCHGNGGSYYYNHHTKTAFPRFDSVCTGSQTDSGEIFDNSPGEQNKVLSANESHRHLESNYAQPSSSDRNENTPTELIMIDDPVNSDVLPYINETAHAPHDHLDDMIVNHPSVNKLVVGEPSAPDHTVNHNYHMQTQQRKLDGDINYAITCNNNKVSNIQMPSLSTVYKNCSFPLSKNEYSNDRPSQQIGSAHIMKENMIKFTPIEKQLTNQSKEVIPIQSGLSQDILISNQNNLPSGRLVYTTLHQSHGTVSNKISEPTELLEDVGDNNSNEKSDVEKSSSDSEPHLNAKKLQSKRKKTSASSSCIVCPGCNKSVNSENILDHPCDEIRYRWKCVHCSSSFFTETDYRNHLKEHKGPKPCDKCGEYFISKDSHQLTCSTEVDDNEETKGFQCTQCGDILVSKTTLRFHMTFVHMNRKEICEICGLSVKHLKSHIARIHEKSIPKVKCNVCNKIFANVGSLSKHKETHTEAKNQCSFCGKLFHQRSNMRAHMRQHTNEKPFKCPICDKQFTHNVSKRNHMAKHHK